MLADPSGRFGYGFIVLALLLSCQPPVAPSADTASVGCMLDAQPIEDSQAASNQVVWTLSGAAQTVEAVATWYDGSVVARTVFDVYTADATGRVAYLPYATPLNLQDEHGDTFTLQLRALDAEGTEQCQWQDTLPFFPRSAQSNHAPPQLTQLSPSARADFDTSLADHYLLHPQEIHVEGTGGAALLYTALGDLVGWYNIDDELWASTGISDKSNKQIANVTLHEGRIQLLTTGYPDLVQSAYCTFVAPSGRPLHCTSTGKYYHHSLFLSDSGTSAFTSQWKEFPNDDFIGSISLAVQVPILDDGSLDGSAPLFQLPNYFDLLGVYQNSFTQSSPTCKLHKAKPHRNYQK